MNAHDKPISPMTTDVLMDEMLALRYAVVTAAAPLLTRFRRGAGADDAAVANLAHYLALRHHDLRPLQRQMMWRGLSSLGRLESRVLPTLDAAPRRARGDDRPPVPHSRPDGGGLLCRRDCGSNRQRTSSSARRRRIAAAASWSPSRAKPPPTPLSSPISHGAGWTSPGSTAPMTTTSAWRAMAANVRAAGERFGRTSHRAHGYRRPEDPHRGGASCRTTRRSSSRATRFAWSPSARRGEPRTCPSTPPSRCQRWSPASCRRPAALRRRQARGDRRERRRRRGDRPGQPDPGRRHQAQAGERASTCPIRRSACRRSPPRTKATLPA